MIKNRVGQVVKPNKTYAYRPECKVESSEEKNYNMTPSGWDTLHVVRYPNGTRIYVWECEWPGRFEE